MKTLLELLPEMERLGRREAVVHVGGFRTRKWSYRDLLRHAAGVAAHLDRLSIGRGDRILLWGENRPEWVAVFWAALARGVSVVPLDFRSSPGFVERIRAKVGGRLLVHGSQVEPPLLGIEMLPLESIGGLASDTPLEPIEAEPSDVVQVLFTSGTTGEPKGVVHRHRNLVSNLAPIRAEIRKHHLLARPFQPIRTLCLLPGSHVFGQFTGLYVPVVLGGSVVFLDAIHPSAIVGAIRRERVSVLSTVPRFLTSLRAELERRFPIDRRSAPGGLSGGLVRWWRHREIHGALGWKFWAILSGGARLPQDDEDFWRHVGLVLVQGYGLTETSSVVATNHPFHPKPGALGRVVGNQEVKLADDGEILVRGDNVSTEYFGVDENSRAETWLHTGDLGEIREDGVLYYLGRKKDVIVGADGMNVHPTDVEAALARQPAVRDAVVIGKPTDSGDVVHAALLLESGSDDAESAVRAANQELEPHQRVREWSVWPDDDFPRTASTFKIRRHEVRERISSANGPATTAKRTTGARELLARRLGVSPESLAGESALSSELGLTSLDRMELLTELEQTLGKELSESELTRVETVAELEAFTRKASPPLEERSPLDGLPRYTRSTPVRAVRTMFRESVIRPLFKHYLPLTMEGSLERVEPPVIFAANHLSNLDTLAILTALPYRLRGPLAPAIQQEYFDPYLRKTGTLWQRLGYGAQYLLACVLVNAFPLPRSSTASRAAMRFAGELADDGYSILIFPEGRLSRDGRMTSFKPGVGLLAVELQLPVVPVHLDGLFQIMSYEDRWPTRGPVRVRFGEPLRFEETADYSDAAAEIEAAVRSLEPPGESPG